MADIFNQDPTITTPEVKDYWAEYTKEGGKFYDPDEAAAKQKVARGKYEADLFIDQLKRENEGLRGEVTSRMSAEKMLEQIQQRLVAPNEGTQTPPETVTPKFNPDELERLLDQKLSEREKQKQRDNNAAIVVRKLREHYGENYAFRLEQEAAKQGLGKQFVNSVATENPEALFKLLGFDAPPRQGEVTPPISGVSFKPNTNGERDYGYYQAIKEKRGNGAYFADTRLQNQMFEDLKRLGEDLFYKDFRK